MGVRILVLYNMEMCATNITYYKPFIEVKIKNKVAKPELYQCIFFKNARKKRMAYNYVQLRKLHNGLGTYAP